MHYRRLGGAGLQLSELGLGTMTFGWTADEATSHAIMDTAVAAGINWFDTADIYSRWDSHSYAGKSEALIGSWLKGRARDEIILATKVRGPMSDRPTDQGLSRHLIMASVEHSLRRLQTDYIDLYQTHFPDEETPLEETLRALDDLIHQGKVRYLGCSNHPAWLLCKALWTSERHGLASYVSVQPHYNLVNRAEVERELQALCLDQAIGILPYSPLAGGFLTGKYRRDQPIPAGSRGTTNQRMQGYMHEHNWALLDQLETVAQAHQTTIAVAALAWVTGAPGVTGAIVGANTVVQLTDTLGAADVDLTVDERATLDTFSDWR